MTPPKLRGRQFQNRLQVVIVNGTSDADMRLYVDMLDYLELQGVTVDIRLEHNMAEIDGFLAQVDLIEGRRADELRHSYVHRFVNQESDYYARRIATLDEANRYVHAGIVSLRGYSGYLWDTLRRAEPIPESVFIERVARQAQLYVLWDLHVTSTLEIEAYWYERGSVVMSLAGKLLLGNLDLLPEDIYTFGDGMDGTLIRTHECLPDQQRECAWGHEVESGS